MEIKLKNVRLSFNDLFTAKAFEAGQSASYSAKVLVEKGSENDKIIRAAILTEANAKFGKKAEMKIEQYKDNNMKCCYVDGDKDNQDEHNGFMILTAKRGENKGRPTIIDGKKNPLTAADGKPYSGCYVNLIADIYVQNKDYEGIRCSLGGVQFAKDGDAFSGGSTPKADDFDEVEDGADSSDSFE